MSNYSKRIKSAANVPELPGFYYDAAKKRYFKVQSNNFGQTSVPTYEWIERRDKQAELEASARTQAFR